MGLNKKSKKDERNKSNHSDKHQNNRHKRGKGYQSSSHSMIKARKPAYPNLYPYA